MLTRARVLIWSNMQLPLLPKRHWLVATSSEPVSSQKFIHRLFFLFFSVSCFFPKVYSAFFFSIFFPTLPVSPLDRIPASLYTVSWSLSPPPLNSYSLIFSLSVQCGPPWASLSLAGNIAHSVVHIMVILNWGQILARGVTRETFRKHVYVVGYPLS